MIKKTSCPSFIYAVITKKMSACLVCASAIVGAGMEQRVNSLPLSNSPSSHGMEVGGNMESRCADVIF